MRLLMLTTVLSFIAFSTENAHGELPSGPGWHAIPYTKIRSVCAADNGFPDVRGAIGCRGITEAWNSGVFDTARNRMIIWGGGHNDYYGNEIYAFDLDDQTLVRLTDPGLPRASGCVEAIAGGTQPNSRHTYDGIEYIAALDKMFVFGGSLSCPPGARSNETWLFDFGTNTWQRMNPSGTIPSASEGVVTGYDPVTGLVYLHDRGNLFSYDATADRYTRISSRTRSMGMHLGATVHPIERKFVIIGRDSVAGGGRVYTYDISGGTVDRVTVATSGGSAVIGRNYPGVEYDPRTDKIAAWSDVAGDSVYFLDLDTGQWTRETSSGPPTPTINGIHGRLRFSPTSEVFVLVNKVDDDIFIFRSDASPVVRSVPPDSLE